MKKAYQIVKQTSNWIAINKAPNLLCIPDRYKHDLPNIQTILQQKHPNLQTVHRIDKETSGIVVFALNTETHKHLNKQFENREVKKRYIAIVHGKVQWIEKTVDADLLTTGKKVVVSKKGKPSVTNFKLIESFNNFSIIECQPITGRTHQIRVHLAHIGLPIIADKLYGRETQFSLTNIKRNIQGKPQAILTRHALHATQLIFSNVKGENVELNAPLPKDMEVTIKLLKKWG